MGELLITFDKESPSKIDEKINIKAVLDNKEELEYKFLEGIPGEEKNLIWKPIQDFSKKNKCEWKPIKAGDYMIMVQYKDKETNKPSIARVNYKIEDKNNEENKEDINNIEEIIYKDKIKMSEDINSEDINSEEGNNLDIENINFNNIVEESKNIINKIIIDRESIILGEKINIEVLTEEQDILYRFLLNGKQDWEILKDYNLNNKLSYTTIKEGKNELLIECKRLDSKEQVEDFKKIEFEVKKQPKIEIKDFICLSEKILVNKELNFKVISSCNETRTLLYKFLKIDSKGRITCIQDYSTKNSVSFYEREKGEYKLLCLVKDIFSHKDYDDRAYIMYEVKPYEEIKIKNFSSNLSERQLAGTEIELKAYAIGGDEVQYRFIVEGPVAEDTGYTRLNTFNWETKTEGEYKITLKVKDISYEGEFEEQKTLNFNIAKKVDKPVRIVDIITTKTRGCIKNEPINIKVKSEGGSELQYSFIVYKDGEENERLDYGITNWINFTPEESGEYEFEIRVLDKYSSREYDVHEFIYFKVRDYQEGEIDYVLLNPRENYLVGDKIELEAIVQNTKSILLRYVTKINGHEVEDTGYINEKKIKIVPKSPGKYTFDIYAKNILCKDEYDNKNEISVYVQDVTSITGTKIKINEDIIEANREVNFVVTSNGGKDVCYEFYIMEKENWIRVQKYSKKNYYTFLPFVRGKYRILVLSKSFYKKVNYEDYAIEEFEVI